MDIEPANLFSIVQHLSRSREWHKNALVTTRIFIQGVKNYQNSSTQQVWCLDYNAHQVSFKLSENGNRRGGLAITRNAPCQYCKLSSVNYKGSITVAINKYPKLVNPNKTWHYTSYSGRRGTQERYLVAYLNNEASRLSPCIFFFYLEIRQGGH